MAWHGEQSLWNSLQTPGKISFRRAAGGWALVTGAVLLLLWLTGPIGSTVSDTMNIVEAGNRVVLGQKLDVDFNASHWGALFVWLLSVGIRLAGTASPVALHCLQAFTAVVFGLLVYLVALPRLRPALALLLLAATELLLITATPVGHSVFDDYGYAMYYNVLCFVPMAALLLSLLIPRRESTVAGHWCDVVLEAAALAMLFETKAWFVVGVLPAFVLVRCLWPRPGEKRFWGLLTLVLFALFAAALAQLSGGVRPYLKILTGYQGSEVNPLLIPMRYVQFTYSWGLSCLAVLIALIFAYQSAAPLRRLIQLGLYSLAALGAFLMGTSVSSQELESIPFIGLVPLAAVLFAARTANEKKAPLGRLGLYSALGLAVLLLVTEPKNQLLSRIFMQKSFPPPASLADPALASVTAADIEAVKYYDPPYQTKVLKGINLLRAAKVPREDVVWIAACWEATCNHVVGNPPSRGGVVVPLMCVTPDRHPLLVPSFLEDTQWALKIKAHDRDFDWQVVMARPDRKAYFESHFAFVSENNVWILYHRTSP